jgi:comEA protein
MFARLVEWLALTATERKVLWFLTITLAIGTGIRLVRSGTSNAPAFDYRTQDSTFAALSAGAQAPPDTSAEGDEAPVDLNAATRSDLMELPGIGAVTADRILQYRSEHGPFASVDDLRKIKGISRKKLDKLRPAITVAPPSTRKSPP